MAIITPDTPVYNHLLGQDCFYCAQPVHQAGVMWAGTPSELVLHAACVIELFLRLGRDVWQIECDTGKYVARTEGFDFRTRLIAEELREDVA